MNPLIQRLVKEAEMYESSDKIHDEEDLPIEYYELREIALERVYLKQSFRNHLLFYIALNVGLLAVNLFANPKPIFSFYDIWAMWPILTWGLAVWIHYWIVRSKTIDNFEVRRFVIIFATSMYLLWFLIFVNYFGNYLLGIDTQWWPWALLCLILLNLANSYITFYASNEEKIEKLVLQEMQKMQKEYENELTKMEKIIQEQNKKIKEKSQKNQTKKNFEID